LELRRGVSPIVATFILILISIAAGVILWVWLSGYISRPVQEESALYERIRVEAVSVSDDGMRIRVYVRNVGVSPVTVASVYIVNARTGTVYGGCFNTSANVRLDPGEIAPIDVVCDVRPLQIGTYMVRAVTASGVESWYTFTYSE